jgi:hypothetical protein
MIDPQIANFGRLERDRTTTIDCLSENKQAISSPPLQFGYKDTKFFSAHAGKLGFCGDKGILCSVKTFGKCETTQHQ